MGMTPARAPSCYICGRRQLAAVRSSCAFRAALPASGTPSRCGRYVCGGECARHERRLSRVRDIKVLEGGTIRAGRRPRCHGAARAWRAGEHEPGERQWAQRSDRPSMNAQGGTTSGSNESAAEGRTLRSGHRSVAVITPKFDSRLQYSPNILNSTQSLLKVVVSLLEHYRYTAFHL